MSQLTVDMDSSACSVVGAVCFADHPLARPRSHEQHGVDTTGPQCHGQASAVIAESIDAIAGLVVEDRYPAHHRWSREVILLNKT